MREGLFIKRNKERWERVQQGNAASADDMAKDFTQLVDDLAYAKTFYPNGAVTQYINALASRIYLSIYQNRKEEANRLVTFWKYDVPQTIGKHHLVLLFSLCVFVLFFSIGFFSSMHDETFVREVLGDGYVTMTEQNIEEGNPFGVYQNGNSFLMWLGIMINNIIVSFMYFVKGIVFGILSLTALAKESIRIGAFEHMFFSKGLGSQAVITVLIHGLLELTAIIIACGAGVVMGKSFLFPGTLSRLEALRQGTKEGVKMIIGLMPVFAIAAFFEGFVTRHYKMPLLFSISILTVSAVLVLGYFVYYPLKLRKGITQSEKALILQHYA
ncbi:MAG: stage II sporulation protein M [Flavisolibacter sp.]|nr:stage II sporulation protein M [Flavisolibacter sp.]MBD0350463.1 stage II sporulation protein M [Flavisolibacter sp.]